MTSLRSSLLLACLTTLCACGPMDPGEADPRASGEQSLSGCPVGSRTCLPEPGTTPTTTQVIVNGGFESGTTGWTLFGTARVDNVWCLTGAKCLHEGAQGVSEGIAYQTVTLSPDAISATASFDLYVYGYYTTNDPDIFTVAVADSQGRELRQLASLYPSALYQSMSTGWHHFGPYDLSAYRGRTVRLVFRHLPIGVTGGTAWGVDNVQLLVKQ